MIPTDGRYLVYAPLRQAAFLGNAAVVNQIADLQTGSTHATLSDPGLLALLRELRIVDGGSEEAPRSSYAGNPQPTEVTLFLTTECNLRCTYCYASAGDTPVKRMALDVAQRGIDFVLDNALALGQSEINIAYHGGGEPSVNWNTLTGSFDYACERAAPYGVRVRASLASNGVMSDRKIDWIIEHLEGVSLSYDGLPEVHDAHRLTILGEGSSNRVEQTIRRFAAAGYPYGLRVTITREHIPRMEESVRHICTHFHPTRIQVEPAYQLGRWSEAPSAETSGFIQGFRAAQAAAREFGYEIEFSAARVGSLSDHFCGITQDSFCLTAEGHVSACYETFMRENTWAKTFFYGEFVPDDNTFRFDLPVLNNLRQQTVDHRPFCEGCFAKWTCGGDCYHKSLAVNGDGEFSGSDRCHVIRELTKDQILDKIAASGGHYWHEPPEADAVRPAGKEALL